MEDMTHKTHDGAQTEMDISGASPGEMTPDGDSPTFKLETFEGPLDLLLALITKNKVSIYDIPISEIFDQYMDYIRKMEMFNMEIASSFIVMASQLMLIKSRLLLPVQKEEEDPRKELVDMLLEYQLAKKTAEVLHERELTFWGRYEKPAEKIEIDPEYTLTHELSVLQEALLRALERSENADDELAAMEENIGRHLKATRQVSVGEKINHVLSRLEKRGSESLDKIFSEVSTKDEAVATFLALLELVKGKLVKIVYHSDDYSDCDIVLNDEDESGASLESIITDAAYDGENDTEGKTET